MKGPRCPIHTHRHYMKNDCDGCKKDRIKELEGQLVDSTRRVMLDAVELHVLRERIKELEIQLNQERIIKNVS